MEKVMIICPDCKAEVEYKKGMQRCPACNTLRIFYAFPSDPIPEGVSPQEYARKKYLEDVGSISEFINRGFEEIERKGKEKDK